MLFSVSPLCSCQDEFFDCVETNEDLKRLRSAADSEPEKASLKETAAITLWMKLLHALPIGNLAGHFSCFHSINSRSGQGMFGVRFKLSSCEPENPLFCDVWQESEGGLSPSISSYSLASSHEEAVSLHVGHVCPMEKAEVYWWLHQWKVKAMALLERTRRSFLERNPSAGVDGCRAQSFFVVFFVRIEWMERSILACWPKAWNGMGKWWNC